MAVTTDIPFATNFNPEINLREVSANGSYWTDGHCRNKAYGVESAVQF